MILEARYGGRTRLAMALFASCGLALCPSPRSGHAMAPRAPAPNRVPAQSLCAWPVTAIGQRLFGNAALIDTAAIYLTMGFGYYRGTALRVHGLFPHARYMSITIYTTGAGGVVNDHIVDRSIRPDRGSVNPFRPYADRAARRRSYTLYLRQGPAPSHGRTPNTLYTGVYHQVYVLYRVYDPDPGVDVYGGVPEPGVEIVGGAPGASSGFTRTLSACSAPRAMWWKSGTRVVPTMQWRRVGVQGSHGGNGDNIYLAIHLNRSGARAYTVRFKAPTFADTNHRRPITGKEDVRFWSLCQYDMATEKVIACLHDYQARSLHGYVTIELSTSTSPAAPKAAGVNWLPFGDEQNGMLLYRQLLPNASFQGSLLRVTPGASQDAVKKVLGVYYPTVTVISATPR